MTSTHITKPVLGSPSLSVNAPSISMHTVKSWPEYFVPIINGQKMFDLRKDDRSYQVGDLVRFEEFRPGVGEYTGANCERTITYILRNFDGLMPGYCILGLGT